MDKVPFLEAWISPKGEIISGDPSHFEIAMNWIKKTDPDSYSVMLADGEEHSSNHSLYDSCYEWMWKNGYGRLVARNWAKDLTIQTSLDYPEHRANLIRRAKKYAKDTFVFKSFMCDRTGKALWTRADTL